MNLIEHYQNLTIEENERDILCLILDGSLSNFNQGIKQLSQIISNHVGAKDLTRIIRDLIPQLVSNNAFITDKNEYLNPKEALDMIDSVLYLEILFEEFCKKSGRRGFFLAHYKSISHDWCYLAYEFVLCKISEIPIKDLLALFIGLNQYELKIISNWSKTERLKNFITLTRRNQIGVFQDGSYIGYKNYKKINDVEDILQIIFEEIDLITNYFYKKSGLYFELFGDLKGETTLPKKIPPHTSKIPLKMERQLSPLEINLKILQLNKLPTNQKELKKIFYKLAMTAHPDKFAHTEQGTRTEIAIIDKFREIHAAYMFVESEIEKIKKS